jgi:hypothetical protein
VCVYRSRNECISLMVTSYPATRSGRTFAGKSEWTWRRALNRHLHSTDWFFMLSYNCCCCVYCKFVSCEYSTLSDLCGTSQLYPLRLMCRWHGVLPVTRISFDALRCADAVHSYVSSKMILMNFYFGVENWAPQALLMRMYSNNKYL